MNGTYTIGSSTADDFVSFSEAIDSLDSKGVNGQVLIRVKAGTYTEQIRITEVSGASSTNRITFESYNLDSSTVIITFAPTSNFANYTIYLASADYFTFKDITFSSGGSSYARVIQIDYGSSFNQFISNRIIGIEAHSINQILSSEMSLIYSSYLLSNNDNNNLFKFNYFKNGFIALEYHGSQLSDEKGTLIEDNYFLNQDNAAIYLMYQDSLIIKRNKIENHRLDDIIGIKLQYCHGGFQILANKINLPDCFSSIGLSLENCNGDSINRALISNNFIRTNSIDTVNIANFLHAGLIISFVENLDVFNNSINITGDYQKSSSLFINIKCKKTVLENNNIVNNANGVCLYIYDPIDSISIDLDFNNYYTPSTYTIRYDDLYYTTDQWKSNTLYDQSSISYQPNFVSNHDLHSFSMYLNGRGTSLKKIIDDYDGQLRDSISPDIGADEFTPFSHDKEIQLIYPEIESNCNLSDSQKISLAIINTGSQSITRTIIQFKISSTDSFIEVITDTIKSQDTLFYTSTSTLNLSNSGFYNLEVEIIDTLDQNASNNHISAQIHNLHSINNFPFSEDFEKSYTDYFTLLNWSQSRIAVDTFSPFSGKYALHCQGRSPNVGWTGSGGSIDSLEAWSTNWLHHTQSISCLIDGQNQTNLRLCFRMRMTYGYGLKSNWFRILVNDTIILYDMDGRDDFNPTSNKDTFALLIFDLTPFCGKQFFITFQTASQVHNKYYNEGDNVFIDDIKIFNPPESDVGVIDQKNPFNSLCGDTNTAVIVVLKNFGYANTTNIPVFAEIETPNGKILLADTFHSVLNPNTTDTILLGYINTKTEGKYLFKSYTDYNEDSFCRQNDTFYFSINFIDAISIPIIESFDGVDSLTNWDIKNMWVSYPGAHNVNSWTLSNSIWANDSVAIGKLNKKFGPITHKTHLLFQYRIVRNTYPYEAMPISSRDSLIFLVSSDCGLSYDTLLLIDSTNHPLSDEMRQMQLPLKNYEDSYLIFQIKIASGNLNMNYYDIDSIVIADLPLSPFLSDTVSCPGDSVSISFSAEPDVSLLWQLLGNTDTLSVLNSITLKDTGIYILTLTDSFGWKNRDTINYQYYQLPQTNAGQDSSVCINDTVYLLGSGGNTFIWSTGDSSKSISFQLTKSQLIYLESVSDEGCKNTDSVFITALPLPIAAIGSDTFSCYGEMISLTASGGHQYLWSTGDSGKTSSFKTYKSDVISVIVINSEGCSSSDSLNLIVHSLPTVYAGEDTSICKNQNIELIAVGASSYHWSNGDSLATINIHIDKNTQLVLKGTDSNRCSNTDTIFISAKDLPVINLGNDTVLCLGQSILLSTNPDFESRLWSTGDTISSILIDSSNGSADSIGIWAMVYDKQCVNSDTIYIRFDSCLSIENQNETNFIEVFPNPAQDWIQIILPDNISSNEIIIELLDVHGRAVIRKTITAPYNSNSAKIRLHNVSEGAYLIRVQDQNIIYHSKVLIH